jgi:type III secretory pathway component EscV
MNASTHVKYMVLGAAALLGIALLAGVPLASALPLAILLACPLMMVLMMGSMSGGHEHGAQPDSEARPEEQRSGPPESRTRPRT